MTVEGLVLKREEYGDRNVYLTLLTPTEGQVRLLCKNARTFKGSEASASQVLAYGEYEYYVKGDTRILKKGVVLNDFFKLVTDYDNYLLSQYLLELAAILTDDGEAHEAFLRCLKNGLYVLQNGTVEADKVKSVLELRFLSEVGYTPAVDGCDVCRRPLTGRCVADLRNGVAVCRDCAETYASRFTDEATPPLLALTDGVSAAVKYVLKSDVKRIFAFSIDERDQRLFDRLAEDYVIEQTDVVLPTLKYYRERGDIGRAVQ